MNPGIIKRTIQLALVASITVIAAACPTPPSPTTTTTSSSTSSSVPGGPCDDYTPTGVSLSTSTTSGTSQIEVSGNGYEGKTVVVTIVDSDSNVTPAGSTVVPSGGAWSVIVDLPNLADGEYSVVATVDDDCSASAALTIVN